MTRDTDCNRLQVWSCNSTFMTQACPCCLRRFGSSRAVHRHLGHEASPCHTWYHSAALLPSIDQHPSDASSSSDREHVGYRARSAGDVGSDNGDSCTDSAASLSEPRGQHVEFHPRPGRAFIRALDIFEEIHVNDEYATLRKENRYYPFSCKQEWGLVVWISQSGLPATEVDKFLRLPYVSRFFSSSCHDSLTLIKIHGIVPSFRTARELHSRIEILPSPPRWKACMVEVPGGRTRAPIKFLFRDGVQCFSFLFGNPIFKDNMEYAPRRVWEDETKTSRLYSETMTGDLPWELQVSCVGYLCV